jgi:hypothetical protein
MTRSHLNIVLALAAVGLGALLWFSREQPETFPPLTPLQQAEVSSIELAHPDAPLIRLEKQGTAWRLTAPVSAPADDFEVSSLVNLATLEIKRSLPLAEAYLKQLQLDPPNYTITLNSHVLGFGDTEPIEFRRYVRSGDQLALVLDPPSAALDRDYSDLVARQLLPAGAQIQRIELPQLTVARKEQGGWIAEQKPDAGSDELQALVDTWRDLRAMWNAARPADAGDAGEPVRIVLADGELNLRIVEREPQLKIDNPAYGVRYTVSRAELDKLLNLPEPTPSPAASPTPPEAEE